MANGGFGVYLTLKAAFLAPLKYLKESVLLTLGSSNLTASKLYLKIGQAFSQRLTTKVLSNRVPEFRSLETTFTNPFPLH